MDRRLKILVLFGTRPEAIKMAPLIFAAKDYADRIELAVCVTGQHREMLDQVLDFFSIEADYDLNLMRPDQSLFGYTANALEALEPILDEVRPDLILVQGDTTTAFVGALAGFYKKTKVAHIEAGLRSKDKFEPFPEEINRILADHIADLHFAPTQDAKDNLYRENIRDNVFVVGNTVVDALSLALKVIQENEQEYLNFFNFVDFSKRILLVTGHRRENFRKPIENICRAIKTLAEANSDIEVVYPVHLNPNVRNPVHSILKGSQRIHCIEPLSYPHLIFLMHNCHTVLTDSGGIQEEASCLGKPVLIMRNNTERVEVVEAGCAKLVGTDYENILKNAQLLLRDPEEYGRMSRPRNLYGDGKASQKIMKTILNII